MGGVPPPPALGDLTPLVNPADAGVGAGSRRTVAELHGLAMTVYDLWAADFAVEPRALALRCRAESTVFVWAQGLGVVARVGLLYAAWTRVDALAWHRAHLTATWQS